MPFDELKVNIAGASCDEFLGFIEDLPSENILSTEAAVGLILHLDEAVLRTDALHMAAWSRLAGELGLPFEVNFRGGYQCLHPLEGLEKLLGPHARGFAREEKRLLAARKDAYFQRLWRDRTPDVFVPGALDLLARASAENVPVACVAAHPAAIDMLGDIPELPPLAAPAEAGAAAPETFADLLGRAAKLIHIPVNHCAFVDVSPSGILTARRLGMKTVLLRGGHRALAQSDLAVGDLSELTVDALRDLCRLPRRPRSPSDPAARRAPAVPIAT